MSACHRTFEAALPYGVYGVPALTMGIVGAITAVTATAVEIKIIGISSAIIGAYGFFSVLICGIALSTIPKNLEKIYPKLEV